MPLLSWAFIQSLNNSENLDLITHCYGHSFYGLLGIFLKRHISLQQTTTIVTNCLYSQKSNYFLLLFSSTPILDYKKISFYNVSIVVLESLLASIDYGLTDHTRHLLLFVSSSCYLTLLLTKVVYGIGQEITVFTTNTQR